jgi:8-oxo-dGTP pyrophosphatase MutT (NUDIX family)
VGRVEVDRPGPGEELNEGPVVDARPAASAILLRDAAGGPEVLLLRRNPASRFMGGAWVFPGGAVHADDEAQGVPGPVAAALRETEEEAGLRIAGPDELVPFSRWSTPAQVKIRFDTWFFIARAPDAEVRIDAEEVVDSRWLRPQEALDAGAADDLLLVFPTIKHLEQLTGFDSVDEALSEARTRKVMAVEPRVLVDGGVARVLMPGEAGYDDA